MQFTLQAAIQRWLGDVIQVRDLEVTSNDSTLSILLTYALADTGEEHTATFTRPV